MNALSTTADFTVVPAPETQWLVLRCAPARTMALAAALKDYGAWTPTWKVQRECKRTGKKVKVTEPCIPQFVFVPVSEAHDLPALPRLSYGLMHQPDGRLIRVVDRHLEPLRQIADKPLIPASKLPKPSQRVKIIGGAYAGFTARVVHCSQRYAVVSIEGEQSPFAQRIQLPPSLLQITAVKAEPVKKALRLRNRG